MTGSYLSKLHSIQIEILDEIVRICDNNGLRYCLAGGTCLGAVRHHGFIPWDDDVDIIMPRGDFNRFVDICGQERSDDFYLDWFTTNPDYGRPFAKFCKKNTLFIEANGLRQAIFVDIFVLDKVPGKEYIKSSLYVKAIHFCDVMTVLRREGPRGRDLKTKLLFFLTRMIPVRFFYRLEIHMMSRFEGKDATYYVPYASRYNLVLETHQISDYEPYIQLPFEGKMYNVPRNYDLYLGNIYGDYMQLPPEEKRVTHYPKFISFNTLKDDID